MLTGPGSSLRISRTRSTVVLAVVMFLWYFYSSFIAGQPRNGFDHLDSVSPQAAIRLRLTFDGLPPVKRGEQSETETG